MYGGDESPAYTFYEVVGDNGHSMGIMFENFIGFGVQYDENATALNDTELDKVREESFRDLARIKFGRTSVENMGLSTNRIVPLRPSDPSEMPTTFYEKYVELMELQMRTIAALQYIYKTAYGQMTPT
jgi:hypothetical protein